MSFLPFIDYLVALLFAFHEAVSHTAVSKGCVSDLLLIALRKLTKVCGVSVNHFLVYLYSSCIKKTIIM